MKKIKNFFSMSGVYSTLNKKTRPTEYSFREMIKGQPAGITIEQVEEIKAAVRLHALSFVEYLDKWAAKNSK